jgi:hypothetical protein
MKLLTLKLVLPLTVISFMIFTKWWYVFPDDAPDIILWGFPFPYAGDGFHTSMSLQIFAFELFIDFLIYFVFWFLIIFSINRFVIKINIRRILTITLLIIAGFVVIGSLFIICMPENILLVKRDFKVEIKETGYKFIWQNQAHPDYHKNLYKIKKKPNGTFRPIIRK